MKATSTPHPTAGRIAQGIQYWHRIPCDGKYIVKTIRLPHGYVGSLIYDESTANLLLRWHVIAKLAKGQVLRILRP